MSLRLAALVQVRASQNENSVLREDIRKLILLLERLRVLCSSIQRNSDAQENAYREIATLLDEMRRRYYIPRTRSDEHRRLDRTVRKDDHASTA